MEEYGALAASGGLTEITYLAEVKITATRSRTEKNAATIAMILE